LAFVRYIIGPRYGLRIEQRYWDGKYEVSWYSGLKLKKEEGVKPEGLLIV
jgi:hypothetical protein